MTLEEIKANVSIEDVAAMYGMRPNRKGFCNCGFPNHKTDKTASLKLYPEQNSFYCYGCQATGDQIAFVRLMESCDFKTAFLRLGGTYKKMTGLDKINLYQAQAKREKRRNQIDEFKALLDRNCYLLGLYRKTLEKLPPMSEVWAYTIKKLEYQEYLNEYYLENWKKLREDVHFDESIGD